MHISSFILLAFLFIALIHVHAEQTTQQDIPQDIPMIVNDGTFVPDPSSSLASLSLPELLSFLSARGIRCYHCQTRDDYLRAAEQVKEQPHKSQSAGDVPLHHAPDDPENIHVAGTILGDAQRPHDATIQQQPEELISISDFSEWSIPSLRNFLSARGRSCDDCITSNDWARKAYMYQHMRARGAAGTTPDRKKQRDGAEIGTTETGTGTGTGTETENEGGTARVAGDQHVREKTAKETADDAALSSALASMTIHQLRQFAIRRGRDCGDCSTHAMWLREATMVQHKRPMAVVGVGLPPEDGTEQQNQPTTPKKTPAPPTPTPTPTPTRDQTDPTSKKDEL